MKLFGFSRESLQTLGIVGLYMTLLAVTVVFHEPWRDEVHSWTIAKQSASLFSLLENTQYEGHPSAWYLILFVLTRFTRSLEGLQVVHFLVAAGFVFLFVKKSPFPNWQKLLFVLGYFALFEYGVLARNYAIELLALFGFCALFPSRNQLWGMALMLGCLALMMFSNVFGLMMGMVLFFAWQVAHLLDGGVDIFRKKAFWISTIAFLTIATLGVFDIAPPSDTGFATRWNTGISWDSLTFALSSIWDAYVPVPQFTFHFWNTNFLDMENESVSLTLKSILGIALLGGAFTSLRHPATRILLITGTLFFLAFEYAKYHGFMRHHGHFFILWVACLWIDACLSEKKSTSWAKKYLFPGLLVIHCITGIGACVMDICYPFSMGEKVEQFIRENDLEEVEMVGNLDFTTAGIAGRLDREMYFPSVSDHKYFMVWSTKRGYKSPEKTLEAARQLRDQSDGPVLILLTDKVDHLVPEFSLKKLGDFEGSLEASEVFYLYLME